METQLAQLREVSLAQLCQSLLLHAKAKKYFSPQQ